MVSVCLLSDALLQHPLSYLGFSYLGRGVSLYGCSSKAQPLLLTLDEWYLLTAALSDLQRRIAPLGPPTPRQPLLLGLLLPAATPGLGRKVASSGYARSQSPVLSAPGRSRFFPSCVPLPDHHRLWLQSIMTVTSLVYWYDRQNSIYQHINRVFENDSIFKNLKKSLIIAKPAH